MKSGSFGIGMKKHGVCGSRNGNGKSPKLKLYMKMKAEADERKVKKSLCTFDSIQELFR